MITTVDSISSLKSGVIQTNDSYFKLKQFARTYPGKYSLNFIDCLSSINSVKTKNYTNFYLTNDYKYSDIIIQDKNKTILSYVYGPLIYGGTYLKFSDIDPRPYAIQNRSTEAENYGIGVFSSIYDEFCDFTIELKLKNKCSIYYTKNYKRYYLCSDIDNNLIFLKEHLITFENDIIGPADFEYVYSEDLNYMFFYKRTLSGEYSVANFNNILELHDTISGDLISNSKNPFKISKNIYNINATIPDNSFITYLGDDTIDPSKSQLSLSNNLLLHKKYMDYDTDIDIITLKNNVLNTGIFSSGNNLLSGGDTSIYVDGLREYTSILNDIGEESSEELELNYVCYNTTYTIIPGDNIFISPSNMYPFEQLNINDTKFIDNGSFAHISPEYADKIYHISDDITLNANSQHLLCTWLSGSQWSDNKVWIDRYYYPDLIDKASALFEIPELLSTYDSYIETLIYKNSNIYDSCKFQKFFDKKSDLIFKPNQQYLYSRINQTNSEILSTFYENSVVDIINYFNNINESGEMSLGFTFFCDESNWVIESDRNDINSGLRLTKNGYVLKIEYDIYDSTSFSYDKTEYSWLRHSKTINLIPLKTNFLYIGIDSKTKSSYFFVNNLTVYTFKLPTYQLYIKQLLYGDFYLLLDDMKLKLDDNQDTISNIVILDKYIPPEIINIYNNVFNISKSDDIYITLPCGMTNNSDKIELLNSICNGSIFKSNFIDINIKNLNISNTNILNGISNSIKSTLEYWIPANTTLNTINFTNYK